MKYSSLVEERASYPHKCALEQLLGKGIASQSF